MVEQVINPAAISGLLDPWIKQREQEQLGAGVGQAFTALQKEDYPGMARALQGIAGQSPQSAAMLLTALNQERQRKLQEQQLAEAQRGHETETYYKSVTPAVVGEGPFGKIYQAPGLPPGYQMHGAAGAAATPQPPQQAQPGQQPQPQPQQQGAETQEDIGALTRALNSNATGDEFLAQVPAKYHGRIKALAGYEEDPRKYIGKQEGWLDLARKYNPEYEARHFEGARRLISGLTAPGPTSAGAQTRSLGTTSHHIDALYELAHRMQAQHIAPTDSVHVNALMQTVAREFGDPTLASWETLRNIVAPEIANTISGAKGLSKQERQTIEDRLRSSNSPTATFATLDTVKGAIAPRYLAFKQWADTASQGSMPYYYTGYLTPAAKLHLLEASGVNTEGLTGKAVETLYKNRTNKRAAEAFNGQFGDGRAEEVLNGLR